MRPPKLLQPSPTAETISPERPRLRCSTGMPCPVTIGRHYRQKKGAWMQQIAAATALPGGETVWVATILFVLTYLLVVTDRINRSIIALLGAGLMIIAGVLTQEEAVRGIDFNTIALLTGMMVLVSISRRCGMFEYLAVWSAKKGHAQPWAMLAMLSLVTAVVSAFLDNVTTVLLMAPVTLAVTRRLEVPPYPFLFAEVFASNIGGTATLIGDPPNIIIGSAANLSFNDFVVHLTPVILVIMTVQLAATHLIWGARMHASAAARAHVMALDERAMIVDRPLLRMSLLVIGAVIAAFVFARPLDLQPGTIAIFGAAILMLFHNFEHRRDREKQTLRRSEEHTSELQSPVHLVCRLLLEKKKKKNKYHIHDTNFQTTP